MRVRLADCGFGALFGFLISWGQFSDPDRIRDMLLLRDPYLYLMMFSAIAVAGAGTLLLRRRRARALATGGGSAARGRADLDRAHPPGAPPHRGRGDLRPRLGGGRLVPGADRGAAHP